MNQKTILAMAASALMLAACGGGGGGGGTPTTLPAVCTPVVPAIRTLAVSPSTTQDPAVGALGKDTAALIAAGELFRQYKAGTATQFGGMGADSRLQPTSDIACGVYLDDGTDVGTQVAAYGTSSAVALYCAVTYGKTSDTAVRLTRHYFKIVPTATTPIGGRTEVEFTVRGNVDEVAVCSSAQTVAPLKWRTAALMVGWTGSAPVDNYDLSGQLPASLKYNGTEYFNQIGATVLDVEGTVSSFTTTLASATVTVVGNATVYPTVDLTTGAPNSGGTPVNFATGSLVNVNTTQVNTTVVP